MTGKTNKYVLGKELEAFERDLSRWAGVKYVIGVNSGTDALYLSLRALEIGVYDEVITSVFSFISPAEEIVNCGADPVFVDIKDDKNIDEDKIKITDKTKAIIPVHLFNKKCEMRKIMKIARKHKLKVIEDSCQHFSKGIYGDLKCFSFYPTKMLGGTRDGGAVLTNSKRLADKIRMLRNHGSDPKNKYLHRYIGKNSRLDEAQAKLLRRRLKKGVFINKQTFESGRYYSIPLHLQPCFRYLNYKKGDFPEAERISNVIKKCQTHFTQ